MYRSSDSDSIDSDKGIRYKTDSIRNKHKSSNKDSSNKRDSYSSSRREKRRSRSRSPRHHDSKSKKLKKRPKERSSEDDDEERRNSRHKERRKDKKDGKRHKEKQRESNTPDKKSRSSKDYPESLTSENKKNCPQMSDVTIKADCSLYQNRVLGPALPPHLLQKDNVHNHHLNDKIDSLTPKSKQKLIDTSHSSSQNIERSFSPSLPSKFDDDSCTNEIKSDFLDPSTVSSETVTKVIGPTLPPGFNKKSVERDTYGPEIPKELDDIDVPALPPDLIALEETGTRLESDKSDSNIGPALPPGFKQKTMEIDSYDLQKEMNVTNPALSPDSQPPDESADRIIGPSLHPDLRKKLVEESSNVGESSEEDEVYGPVPVGENISRAHLELEERALKLKIDQLEPDGDKQPSREEWMLTLPEARAAKFGLGPRSFRAKAGPDLSDRSSWTDTPEDRAKKKAGKVEPKVDLQKEAELKAIRKRDEEQEAIAKKNKKQKESLLDIHQKKLKKEKGESGPSERRPFSREIDLQVNRFDEAQKKAVLKKAQLLDSRFSTGESKYL